MGDQVNHVFAHLHMAHHAEESCLAHHGALLFTEGGPDHHVDHSAFVFEREEGNA